MGDMIHFVQYIQYNIYAYVLQWQHCKYGHDDTSLPKQFL